MNKTAQDNPQASASRGIDGYRLGVGYGTLVRIDRVDGLDDGDNNIQVHYTFLQRGRQSRRQIQRRLRRFFENALVAIVAEHTPGRAWQQRLQRARHWNARHIDISEPEAN